jgi:hypothetical protein
MSTPEPLPQGRDNLALARYAKALRMALIEANQDKAALREWFSQTIKPNVDVDND